MYTNVLDGETGGQNHAVMCLFLFKIMHLKPNVIFRSYSIGVAMNLSQL